MMVLLDGRGRLSAASHPAPARREPPADCIPSVTGMYFTTYNRDMGEITMEPAYHGIEEETVTRLPSKAFDEFLKALDRPVPQTARDLIGMEPDWL